MHNIALSAHIYTFKHTQTHPHTGMYRVTPAENAEVVSYAHTGIANSPGTVKARNIASSSLPKRVTSPLSNRLVVATS